MGTLVGHVLHGLGFLLIGSWQLFNHVKLHALCPNSYTSSAWFSTKILKYMELYIIMAASAFSIAMELFIGPARHQPLDLDGTIPSNHLNNFEHSSISMSFFTYALFAIFLDIFQPNAQTGLTHILAAFAFSQQFLLFHFHSTDHMGVEGQYHLLLQFLVIISLSTTLIGVCVPKSFLISFVRSVSIILQGIWLMVMGFMLWTPELIPKGCSINSEEGHEVVRCEGDHSLHRAKSLVNILFSWINMLVTIFGTLFYLIMTKVYAKKVEYWPLEKLEDEDEEESTHNTESRKNAKDESTSFIHIGKGAPSMDIEM